MHTKLRTLAFWAWAFSILPISSSLGASEVAAPKLLQLRTSATDGTIDWADAQMLAGVDRVEIARFGLQVQRVRVERTDRDAFLWHGRVIGALGDAVLAVRGQRVAGRNPTPAGVLAVEAMADGTSRIFEVESDAFDACAGGKVPPIGVDDETIVAPETSAHGKAALGGETTVIDVLVLFTHASRASSGGVEGIMSTVDASIASANSVFANSGVDLELRVVAAKETSIPESGDLETDLDVLAADAHIGRLRDAYGADMVAMMVEHQGACGQAFVQRRVGADFAPWSYQVTARHCAVANLSFAHETGHVLGAEHDPGNAIPSQYASYRWSFGHYHLGRYRTLMAYPTPCTGCPRVPYFSSPTVVVDGLPTGVDGYRDNARTVRSVARVVAGFRDEVVFVDGFESGDLALWSDSVF